jgi:hypothetical protein
MLNIIVKDIASSNVFLRLVFPPSLQPSVLPLPGITSYSSYLPPFTKRIKSKLDRTTSENQILDLYTKGKINDSHYILLKNKITEF